MSYVRSSSYLAVLDKQSVLIVVSRLQQIIVSSFLLQSVLAMGGLPRADLTRLLPMLTVASTASGSVPKVGLTSIMSKETSNSVSAIASTI